MDNKTTATPDPLADLLRQRRLDEAEAARLQADPADLAAARFLLAHLARKGEAEQARTLALRGLAASGGHREMQLMLGQAWSSTTASCTRPGTARTCARC